MFNFPEYGGYESGPAQPGLAAALRRWRTRLRERHTRHLELKVTARETLRDFRPKTPGSDCWPTA